jgi:hypothetical protein
MSVDLAAKLWSFRSLRSHKVYDNSYSCHALQDNTVKHITTEQPTCFSMYKDNHHRIRTQATSSTLLLYLFMMRHSIIFAQMHSSYGIYLPYFINNQPKTLWY